MPERWLAIRFAIWPTQHVKWSPADRLHEAEHLQAWTFIALSPIRGLKTNLTGTHTTMCLATSIGGASWKERAVK